jgi:hypothetical protein
MSTARNPSAPRPRPSRSARDFAAAKAEYLAGPEAEAVCRRHDIRPAYFLRIAGEQGWRRPDPAPPPPEPTPAAQDDPLVIPEAPQAPSGTPAPLTAAQMADKAWAMLSAAVAAGRLIEARGWLRLHKELQPFAREEAEAERRARMDRDAAALRAAGEARDEAVAPSLHCSSPPECNTPDQRDAPSTPSPSGSTGGSRHADAAEPCSAPSAPLESPVRPGNDGRVEAGGQGVARPLHCFSPPECNGAPSSDSDDVALQLHCFSRPESNNAGPDP